jgi:hypothetical protein
LISVPRPVPGFAEAQPAYRDQAQPEVADLGQHPVQRGLISEQARDGRLRAVAVDLQTPNQAAQRPSSTPSTRIS